MPEQSERPGTEKLVRAAQQGSRLAFRRLYEEHVDRVYGTALRLLARRSDAEDAVQEVFAQIYRKLSSFNFESAFRTWCYRITVNVCYDRMRKQERRGAYHGDYPEGREPADSLFNRSARRAAEENAGREIQRQVAEGLGQLSPELRATFVLKEMEGLSYREIAGILDCAEGTVASRLARARRQMAEHLRSVGIDETYLS